MANPEHVERLLRSARQGCKWDRARECSQWDNNRKWNQWRQEHPEIQPDLSGADLSHTDLCKTNLSGADLNGASLYIASLNWANLSNANLRNADLYSAHLRGANLTDVDFSGANLSRADLSEVDLISADLSGLDLSSAHLFNTRLSGANLSSACLRSVYLGGADLGGADLSYADLSGADLSETNLSHANLSYANFNQTVFHETLFAWVDLSLVEELETAIHGGPSTVNVNSVVLPHDEQTRLHFLRGIGFTETQIDYLPSILTPRPIQYQSLFISNAHQDEAIALRLYTSLRKKDVPCWFAKHDLRPGNYYRQGIDQAIHSQDRVLLLLSEYSVQSGWVRYEVELALSRENNQQKEILYPIRLDDAIFDCNANWAGSLRATRHIGDFTGWQDDATYQQAFDTLLQHLKVSRP